MARVRERDMVQERDRVRERDRVQDQDQVGCEMIPCSRSRLPIFK